MKTSERRVPGRCEPVGLATGAGVRGITHHLRRKAAESTPELSGAERRQSWQVDGWGWGQQTPGTQTHTRAGTVPRHTLGRAKQHTHTRLGCRARAPSERWGRRRRNRWGPDSPHPAKGQVISVPVASQGRRATSMPSCEDSSLAKMG